MEKVGAEGALGDPCILHLNSVVEARRPPSYQHLHEVMILFGQWSTQLSAKSLLICPSQKVLLVVLQRQRS